MLAKHYPGIDIKGVAKTSGQRIVYFCTLADFIVELPEGPESRKWSKWGDVVVKVSSTPSSESITRLSKEIEILKQLNSQNFPKLFHHELLTFDPSNEMPLEVKLLVTVEEKIPSEPLSECMDLFTDQKTVSELITELILSLVDLWEHKQRYVHRDLKPDNILIRNDRSPVIIDLGIVRETGKKGITLTHAFCGPCTPSYASPEQLRNDKLNINFKSDMFTLGVIAYQLMSNQHPFYSIQPATIEEALGILSNHRPRALSEFTAANEDFSNIVSKLLEYHPYKRYRRYQTVLDQLSTLRE